MTNKGQTSVCNANKPLFSTLSRLLWKRTRCTLVDPDYSGVLLWRQVLKGLSFKPSGDCIVVPIFCFLSWRLQILASGLFFYFIWLCKVLARLDKIYILCILRRSPFDVFCFCNLPKIQRGDPCKMSNINVVQPFWNFAQLNKIKK